MKPYTICKRGIARTYQIVRPFLNLTVAENIMTGVFFGRRQAAAKGARAKALEILDLLHLSEKRDRPAKDTHGG